MYALVFALLCGTARAQVLQGCFLKTDPPISLTSRSMDPSLCQKRCPSSRYILLAPTLNDEFNFMCSCAANLPTSVSGSCNMPCPGTFGPSAGVLCGGYRFSQTSVGWSGYAVVQGGPAPPVVQPVVPSQAPVPPAPPVQVETAAASIAPSPVVPVPMPPAQVETAIISTVPSLAIVSPPIQSEPTATVGPAASTSNVVITSLQAASSQSTVTAGPVASQPSTALISTMTTDSSAVHAETASTFTSTTAPSNSSDVSTQAFQQANTLPLQTLLTPPSIGHLRFDLLPRHSLKNSTGFKAILMGGSCDICPIHYLEILSHQSIPRVALGLKWRNRRKWEKNLRYR
ncbi:hypothetical protein BC830DRAFT_923330 [Chytriomyces sp. MP71]|nr:hypothetical protein BC830DRAFT_923330 [Chytriomyces sp. MP71]